MSWDAIRVILTTRNQVIVKHIQQLLKVISNLNNFSLELSIVDINDGTDLNGVRKALV